VYPAPRVAVPERARENDCSGSDEDTIVNMLIPAAARGKKVIRIVIAVIFIGVGIHHVPPRPGTLLTGN